MISPELRKHENAAVQNIQIAILYKRDERNFWTSADRLAAAAVVKNLLWPGGYGGEAFPSTLATFSPSLMFANDGAAAVIWSIADQAK